MEEDKRMLRVILTGGNELFFVGELAEKLHRKIDEAGARGAAWTTPTNGYVFVINNIGMFQYESGARE